MKLRGVIPGQIVLLVGRTKTRSSTNHVAIEFPGVGGGGEWFLPGTTEVVVIQGQRSLQDSDTIAQVIRVAEKFEVELPEPVWRRDVANMLETGITTDSLIYALTQERPERVSDHWAYVKGVVNNRFSRGSVSPHRMVQENVGG